MFDSKLGTNEAWSVMREHHQMRIVFLPLVHVGHGWLIAFRHLIVEVGC